MRVEPAVGFEDHLGGGALAIIGRVVSKFKGDDRFNRPVFRGDGSFGGVIGNRTASASHGEAELGGFGAGVGVLFGE